MRKLREYYSRVTKIIAIPFGFREIKNNIGRKGLIIIQIDGASYGVFKKALRAGKMPYCRKLIKRGDFKLDKYRCGLPSDTPSIQSGIMFGDNFNIPGYRWFNKEDNNFVSARNSREMGKIEERLSKQRESLIRGGSSFFNLFNAQATTTSFVQGKLTKEKIDSPGIRKLFFMFLNPFWTLALIFFMIKEFIQQVIEKSLFLITHRPVAREGFFPLKRICVSILLSEVSTLAATLDIKNNVPAVYISYFSYDEMAHHFGVDQPNTLNAFKSLDAHIKRIDRSRQYAKRKYELIVLSDHGQTRSIPFQRKTGQKFSDYVTSLVPKDYKVRVCFPGVFEEKKRYEKEKNILLFYSSPLVNLYITPPQRKRVYLSQIRKQLPKLLDQLTNHPEFSLILAKEGEKSILLKKQNEVVFDKRGKVIGGNYLNLLKKFEEPEVAIRQIGYFSTFPAIGDLVLFGRYENGLITTLEDHMGAHGSLGGDQGYPFVLRSKQLDLSFDKVENAKELYQMFKGVCV